MRSVKVLVTGANSFIGRNLCRKLVEKRYEIVSGVHNSGIGHNTTIMEDNELFYESINGGTSWSNHLRNIDVIVHLAGRVHITNETAIDPLAAFRQINTFGSENLAIAAAEQGVKRFIFLSSIGVNGNKTISGPFTEEDEPSPYNDYTTSKYEAEIRLKALSSQSDMELVTVRAPLVYGPDVKANFLSLLHIISKEVPLPLGSVNNLRSYIGLDNLSEFIALLIEHPNAVGELFLVSDDQDISTPDLIRLIALLMDKDKKIIKLPIPLLYFGARLFKRLDQVEKLCSSLRVDVTKAKKLLSWSPTTSLNEGLEKTVRWFENR